MLALALVLLPTLTVNARAAGEARSRPVPIDRVALRFSADELGGPRQPRFITRRLLAFEARLEALAGGGPRPPRGFKRRHVRAAMERHIAETLLAERRIHASRAPSQRRVRQQLEQARHLLEQRVGGRQKLRQALRAERISSQELRRLLRRQARASLYLDLMVAPMLRPSEAELRSVHRVAQTPFRGQPFEDVKKPLRRWYVTRRLKAAIASFYEEVRSRVRVQVVP